MAELHELSLCELAEAIATRSIGAVEATEAAIGRARRIQPIVNCFISIDEEHALSAARLADEALARGDRVGPLHGVPLAHKDMFYRQGQVTTGGSRLLLDYRPDVTATVVNRLNAAGAIWLGALNMSEFAANPTGHNESFGHCRNAWNSARISGGSSSGSGVAVAARACYGSLGSDTGGSIRLPAAANGVVGLRPTYGRVSRHGILPRTWSLDTVGPLTRTVRDCARITRVIAGSDPLDSSTSCRAVPDYESLMDGQIEGLRIGVPSNYYGEHTTPDVVRSTERSLALLASLGAELIPVEIPDAEQLFHLSNLISQVEAAAIHAKWLREWPDDYPLVLRTRIESGFFVPAVTYLDALSARARLVRRFADVVFSKVDVVHTPTMNMTAPSFEEMTAGASSEVLPILARMSRNTRPNTLIGLPALAVPAGFGEDGLPISFQLIGRPFDEATLFKIGDAYQRQTDWHNHAPTL